jgi:hypothetical protein
LWSRNSERKLRRVFSWAKLAKLVMFAIRKSWRQKLGLFRRSVTRLFDFDRAISVKSGVVRAGMCALNGHGQGEASTSAETCLYKALPGLVGG